jgi:adenine-specific DNA-methyltransferase
MPKNAKDSVREVLSSIFDGKPNQASAFFYKSILSLKADGIIGCVMPSSILTLDSYRKLRSNILDNTAISLIGKLGNFIFEDALTDVSIIVAKKQTAVDLPLVLWTRNDKGIAHDALRDLRKMSYGNLPLINTKEYSIYKPARFPINNDDWKLISYNENGFLNKIERSILTGSLTRISEVFDVQQGIRSGSNTVFKLKKNEYDLVPEDERKYFRPVIDNDSIKNNVLYKKNYIWYPYNLNGLILKNEEELIQFAPYFYKTRLKTNEKELKDRKGISEWWGLTRPRKAQYTTNKGICTTEFGKADSFAFDYKGEFVIERGNSWTPKKEFKDDDYYYFYLAIFSSPFFDSLLSIYSKQLAGGYWYDLGKKYTKNIPIPKFNKELAQQTSFVQLVQMGKDISEDNFNDYALRESIIKESIYPAYGGAI